MPLITRIDTLHQQPSQEDRNDLIVLVANKLAPWVKTFMRTGRFAGRYTKPEPAEAAVTLALLDAGASPEAVRWCFRVLPQGFGQTYQEKGEVYADNSIAFARQIADTSVPVEVEQVHLNAGGKASLRVRVVDGPHAGMMLYSGLHIGKPDWRWPFVHAGLPVPDVLAGAKVLEGVRLGARLVGDAGGFPKLKRWVTLEAATRPWAAEEEARRFTGPWDPVLTAMTQRGLRVNVARWKEAVEVHRRCHRLPAEDGDNGAAGALNALSRYADRVLVEARADPEHRVHPIWRQEAWTTRIGAFEPAIQNITRRAYTAALGADAERVGDLRAAVIPSKGHVFVVADWSHAHVRIAAGLSRDPQLLADIVAGDVYEQLGERVLQSATSVRPDCAGPRGVGKRLAVALLFGAGPPKLVEKAHELGVVLTEPAARQVHQIWWNRYNVLDAFRHAHASWTALRTSLGTPVYVPPAKQGRAGVILAGFLQALEADALRVVLALSGERMAGTGAVPILQNRDEVVWEVAAEYAVEARNRAQTLMLQALSAVCGPCPAEVDVDIRASWSDADVVDVRVRPRPG